MYELLFSGDIPTVSDDDAYSCDVPIEEGVVELTLHQEVHVILDVVLEEVEGSVHDLSTLGEVDPPHGITLHRGRTVVPEVDVVPLTIEVVLILYVHYVVGGFETVSSEVIIPSTNPYS